MPYRFVQFVSNFARQYYAPPLIVSLFECAEAVNGAELLVSVEFMQSASDFRHIHGRNDFLRLQSRLLVGGEAVNDFV